MTTYNTGNALGSSDPRDLYDNAENLDNFANGPANTYPDRLGVTRKSLAGMRSAFDDFLQSSGYTVPAPYAAGIALTAYNQLIEYNDEFYKLKAGQAPYTTTGTWGTDSAKLVAVGDAALRQELTSNANDFNLLPEISNYAALRAYTGPATAYYVRGVANIFDGGAGVFRVDASDTTTADNNGTVLVDASGRRWKRERPKILSAQRTYGTYEKACVSAVQGNQGVNVRPAVLGLTSSSALSNFPSRDTVALYVDNANPEPLHDISDVGTTYSSTTISFSTPISTADLRTGMIIDTRHPPKWSGFVTGFGSGATTTSITVENWRLRGGGAGVPADGTGAIVNPVTKAWAINANLRMSDNSQYSHDGPYLEGSIVELGLLDTSTKGTQPLTVGCDAVVLETRDGKFGYWARGASHSSNKWTVGYVAWDHSDAGFKAQYGKSGSNNYESIGFGETSGGTFTGAGFYDFQSSTSYMAQPSSGGDAYLCRAPNGSINRYQVEGTGKVSIRTTDASRALSIKSQDDSTEYFGINATGQVGPFAASIVNVTTTNYTVVGGNHIIICASGSSGGTITLPSAVSFPGRVLEVINRSGGGITLDGSGTQTIEGSLTLVIVNGASARIISDGANWLKP